MLTSLVTIIIGILFIFAFVILKVLYRLTHPNRQDVIFLPEDYGFTLNKDYERIEVYSSKDDALLNGWYFFSTNENNKTIIIAHGYGDNRLQFAEKTYSFVAKLLELGYSVLLFDFRNHGISGGNLSTVGLLEQYNLEAMIDWVVKLKGNNEKIILWGFSMGAATSLIVGCKNRHVFAVIADSPFADLRSYLKNNLSIWTNLPSFPFTNIILWLAPLIYKLKIEDVSPINEIKKSYKKNVFIIHGKNDKTIPYINSQIIYEEGKNNNNIEIWFPSDTRHVENYIIYENKYINRVDSFLAQI